MTAAAEFGFQKLRAKYVLQRCSSLFGYPLTMSVEVGSPINFVARVLVSNRSATRWEARRDWQ